MSGSGLGAPASVPGATHPKLEYRSDIDGLRALAVLSVILAHAGVPFLAGGFLGVDVFFVISGFLIARIVRSELDAERFALARFYERRARRILPALVFVVAACVPFAAWLMLPEFLENFSQSVVATLLFANNILLAMTTGYWELRSAFKPLLHTWSLGVEEQFYLLFPLAMIVLVRFGRFGRRGQLWALALMALVSFALSEHGWRNYPAVSFYLPTSRAWELLAGVLASYVVRPPARFDGALAALSLLAVAASMAVFGAETPSPSLYSAVPVLGTVGILLFNRPGSLAWRVLSLRPVVFLGLISYSAYLWHQPLFAFARVASFDPPGPLQMAGLTMLTLVLAAVTWRYVETPFRNHAVISRRRFVGGMALVTAVLLALGLGGHVAKGFPRWTHPNIAADDDVYIAYNEAVRDLAVSQFTPDAGQRIVLVGNSFARDIGNVMLEAGALEGAQLAYVEDDLQCAPDFALGRQARGLIVQADVIVVALNNTASFAVPDVAAALAHEQVCLRTITARLRESSAAPIVVFGSKHFGLNTNPFGRVPLEQRAGARAKVPPALAELNDGLRDVPGIEYIDLLRLFGDDGRTVRFFDDDGNPLSPDRLHLTRYGARFAARELDRTQPEGWQLLRSPLAGNGSLRESR